MLSTLRLFIAVELPEEVLRYIGETVGELRQHGITGIRWVRGEGVHLTLRFLGNVPERQVQFVLDAMSTAAAGIHPFALQVHGAGAFPNLRVPRVLWLGVQGEMEPLLRFHGRLEEALEACGFPREPKAFTAHLTLGRVNGRLSPLALANLTQAMEGLRSQEPLALPVTALSLIESQLTPQGAIYQRKGQAPLSP